MCAIIIYNIFIVREYIWRKANGFIIFLLIMVISLIIPSLILYYDKEGKGIGTNDLLEFYGSYLSFIGTFGLGYFIYKKDEKIRYDKRISKCKLLCSTLDHIQWQMLRLSRGVQNDQIKYDYSWKEYFFEYELLIKRHEQDVELVLQKLFGTVDDINIAIAEGDYLKAKKMHHNYLEQEKYSLAKYNTFEVHMNIRQDTYYSGFKMIDKTPWELRKGVEDTIKKGSEKYFYIVENWLYNYLIKNKLKSIEYNEIEKELVEWLLTNEEIKKLETPTMGRRIIVKIIFTINCNLGKQSKRLDYCWGEVSLK